MSPHSYPTPITEIGFSLADQAREGESGGDQKARREVPYNLKPIKTTRGLLVRGGELMAKSFLSI